METVLDTYQQVVHSNATVTATGSSVVAMNFGHKEVSLVINVTVAPTGTTPSITYTVQEVDPGNGTTLIGQSKSGTAITGITTQIITLPVMYGGDVQVSWTVTGTGPSFTGVYATLVNKGPSPAIYDQAGNGPVAVKAASTAVAAADPSMAVGLSPNSPLPAGSNALGSVSVTGTTTISGTVNQGTANTLANAWPTEITDGTHGPVAVKAASTAVAAADPSLAVGLSPNSPLPAGTNAIGTVAQGTAAALAGAWPVEVTDGTHTLPTADVAARKAFVALTDGTNTTAVKAASTAAAAADPSAVVALSPNSPVPAGTNTIGVVNQGTAASVANSWTTEITDGTHGPAAVKAASTAAVAADPSLVVALSPNSPTPGVADITATGALGALNAAVTITTAGTQGVGFQLASGTLVGTIVAEVSYDGGTTWNSAYFDQNNKVASIVFGSANTAQAGSLLGEAGAGEYRVRVSAFTSGTANITLRASEISDPTVLFAGLPAATVQPPTAAQIAGWDGTTFRVPTVKAASTAIAAGDQPLAVGLHPTSPLPAGTNTIGVVNQGTAASVANSWTTEITDGTHGPTAVKAASTAAVAADPSLVTAFSPNSPLPAGSNTIGALTANQSVNLAQVGGTSTVTGGVAGSQGVGGLAAAGAALAGNPVLVAGSDGVDARSLLTDTSGRQIVVGGAAVGAAPAGNPVLHGVVAPSGNMENVVGGSDGEMGVAIMGNDSSVHSNSTITASGSTTITKSFYGVQQINLIVNVTAAPTGTTPTITYTIQELDPGNGTTTMGNSSSTSSITGTGVFTASLATSTSSSVKVSWTVTGTTPSFTGVYATVVSKATPATQTTSTTSTTSTPGISPGYITTTSKTNVALTASTYNEQSANFTGSVSSGSANDTSAGTGARTITITWMNSTGTTTGTESATMNGTTAVNLVTTTKCFIEKIQVATVGSTGSNAGAITLFSGATGGGTAVAIINATDNQTYLGHHYVISGKTCHVTDMTGETNSSNQATFTLQAVNIPVAGLPSLQISDWIVGSQTFQIQRIFSSQLLVVGPARLQMFVAPGATASITSQGSFDYFDQ